MYYGIVETVTIFKAATNPLYDHYYWTVVLILYKTTGPMSDHYMQTDSAVRTAMFTFFSHVMPSIYQLIL